MSRQVAICAVLLTCACETDPPPPTLKTERLQRANPLEWQLKARVRAQADAGAEPDAGLEPPADPLPEWAVLPPNPTAANLEQAVVRAAPIAKTEKARQQLLSQVALELLGQLRKKDPAALALAQKWAAPTPPAVASALADAPLFALVLGVWKLTQGEVRAAARVFDRGLAADPGAATENVTGSGAPTVGYALLLVHRACLHEETANRAEAIGLLKKYEERLPFVQGAVDALSGTFDFEDYALSSCARTARAAQLAALPVVFAAQRVRGTQGDKLVTFVRNVTNGMLTVIVCPDDTGEGWIPSVPLRTRGAAHALPQKPCKSSDRFLAPGKAVAGELKVGDALGGVDGGAMPLIEISVDLVSMPESKTTLRYLLGGR